MKTMANLVESGVWFMAVPDWTGKAAFMGVFAVLVLMLVLLPPRLAGETRRTVPWWQRARLWAILIALTQILLYACWG